MGRTRLSSVERTFEIMEVMSTVGSISPTELAARVDIPVSTAHNYLTTLHDIGYALEEGGEYSLSPKLLAIGSRTRMNYDLYNCSKHVVEEMAKRTKALGAVGMKENKQITFVHVRNESQSFDIKNYPGMQLPLHATANGKIVLAELSKTELHSFIDDSLDDFTEATHTDVEGLANELKTIRERGYAYNDEEYERGVMTVAAPIKNDDDLIGTISITDLKKRMEEPEHEEMVIETVQEAANVVEINLNEHPAVPSTEEL